MAKYRIALLPGDGADEGAMAKRLIGLKEWRKVVIS